MVAVILMVGITVVLAATVGVWVTGFTDTTGKAPTAAFQATGCDTDNYATSSDEITVKLTSADSTIDAADLRAVVYEVATGEQVGVDATVGGSVWNVGESHTLNDSSGSNAWDLENNMRYSVDVVHEPTGSTLGSPEIVC